MALTARAATPVLLAALLLPAPALAADDSGSGGLQIVEVGPRVESGGYPTTGWGWNGLSVTISDDSPDSEHVYTVTVTPAAGGDPVTATWEPYDGWDGSGVVISVGDRTNFAMDAAYQVSLTEHEAGAVVGATEPRDYVHEAVGHPVRGVLDQKRAGGRNTVKAGSKVRLTWTGSWEAGTSLTQVVYAVAKNGSFRDRDFLFCEGSYCPTRKGVRWVDGGTDPVRSFKVPKRMAGKSLIVVSYGSLLGDYGHLKMQWGWEWRLKIRKGA